MKRFLRRRGVWALALSLFLHAAAVLLLVLAPEERPAAPHPHPPIELEVVMLEPPPPPEPAPKPVEPPKPAAAAPRAPAKKQAAEASAAPTAPSPQASPLQGERERAAAPLDAPRELTLTPSGEFAVTQGAAGIDPELPRGRTIRNSPDEQPDPAAMAEYTGEKLGRRSNSMVSGMVADAQAKSGLVDPYFTGARKALEADLSAGDVPLPKNKAAQEGFKGLLKSQENFGKTGNPFAPGDEPKWDQYSIARNENQGMAMQLRDPQWGAVMRQAEQSMAAGEATMRAMDHAWVEAILELVQEPGGGIADAHIVKSSGHKDFDEYVLHRARKVFLKLDDPPDVGHGISSAGWRTLWRFSYWPLSIAEKRGQRVRVELLRVEKGQGSGNPLEHVSP